MSGYFHYYKIDQSKTKTVLYKIITNKNIEPKFNINMMAYYKNQKDQDGIDETSISKENGWVKSYHEYMVSEKRELTYNTIVQKVKEDFNTLTHSEFEDLTGWCLRYFIDEKGNYQYDEEEKLGLYDIGYLFSKNEIFMFEVLANNGIDEYYYKLKDGGKDDFWTFLSPPCNYLEFNLALDLLILLCYKINSKKEILTSRDNQLMDKLKLNANFILLDKSTDAYLEDIFAQRTESEFDREWELYLIDCSETLIYKFSSMKEGIEGYKGKIFRVDGI
ncbi:hypothetical protein [uncultured Dokdonia sp.]|uniref:hypothetical protein n=1 Tax=uncultured Dokdonia sp. TaxID=575653 RepID=UPI002624E869|nr:hypothetical protein [uncultured Dokdonia sp.]